MKKFIQCTLILFAMIFSGINGVTQPDKGEDFTLLIYGTGISEAEVKVDLKANPGLTNKWVRVDNKRNVLNYTISDKKTLYAITRLSMRRYVGQDIRENYIALRIENKHRKTGMEPEFRAAWAIKQGDEWSPQILKKWGRWILNEPLKMRNEAFASIVYPTDRILPPNKPLIEHVELPVRHLKAGVQEVKWLEILFTGSQ